MRIAITGATGLLGRNLLFEILKQNLSSLSDLEIVVFGRQSHRQSLEHRLVNIIRNDGFDYLGVKNEGSDDLLNEIRRRLVCVNFDLTQKDLSISQDGFKKLKGKKIDKLFHVAALSDFRVTPEIRKMLSLINVDGTKHMLDLSKELGVENFIYTGSAYSAGFVEGDIAPDFVNIEGEFRNYYEKTKLLAELYLKDFAKREKINYKIFRLTGIGGRLMEKPIGSICKYDIFYGWMQFFLKQKLKHIKGIRDIYDATVDMPLRIALNKKGGMNIVPADYSAKMIFAACDSDTESRSYHIVNDVDIPNEDAIKIMLESINIRGYEIVGQQPRDKTPFEKLYYRSAGQIFTPYVITGPICYNHDNLRDIRERFKINCPKMTEESLKLLLDYAKADRFGMRT